MGAHFRMIALGYHWAFFCRGQKEGRRQGGDFIFEGPVTQKQCILEYINVWWTYINVISKNSHANFQGHTRSFDDVISHLRASFLIFFAYYFK